MATIGFRIEELRLQTNPLLSQAELARRVGMSQGALNGLIRGRSRNTVHLPRIARVLGTSAAYLLGETADSTEGALPAPTPDAVAEQLDAVLVPMLGDSYGLGGRHIDAGDAVQGHVTFSRAWLRGRIEGTIDDIVLITGEGDSMEPTIRSGDVLLVDRAQRQVRQQDQIWAIAVRDLGMVKRLRRGRGGGYEILSDNKSVPADRADDGEMEIIGRVIWIGRWQ